MWQIGSPQAGCHFPPCFLWALGELVVPIKSLAASSVWRAFPSKHQLTETEPSDRFLAFGKGSEWNSLANWIWAKSCKLVKDWSRSCRDRVKDFEKYLERGGCATYVQLGLRKRYCLRLAASLTIFLFSLYSFKLGCHWVRAGKRFQASTASQWHNATYQCLRWGKCLVVLCTDRQCTRGLCWLWDAKIRYQMILDNSSR